MKHIKTYESWGKGIKNIDYKIDDYIYIKAIYFTDRKGRGGKIINVDYDNVPFEIIFDTRETMYVSRDQIERKLTDNEITNFELKLASNKYNL
jgi:hypothetical protein